MSNIAELLKGGEQVSFELDGKSHKVSMQPPTAAIARELRDEFYRLGERVNSAGDNAQVAMASDFEEVIGKVVKACFPADSEEAKMDDDTVRLFILRIGGDKSQVVQYAMRVCGIRFDNPDAEDAVADPAFS